MPIKTDVIMRSINLSYLGFEDNFLFFFWISLPTFLTFLFFSVLRFRFSLFVPMWLSSLCCFWTSLLLSSFWFFCFFCQSPSEPSLASLPFLSLRSLNSDSWTERRIKERNRNIACLPREIILASSLSCQPDISKWTLSYDRDLNRFPSRCHIIT